MTEQPKHVFSTSALADPSVSPFKPLTALPVLSEATRRDGSKYVRIDRYHLSIIPSTSKQEMIVEVFRTTLDQIRLIQLLTKSSHINATKSPETGRLIFSGAAVKEE